MSTEANDEELIEALASAAWFHGNDTARALWGEVAESQKLEAEAKAALSQRLSSQSTELATLRAELARSREACDGAYRERNQVVAALAKCFPSGLKKTAIEGWDPAWHNCVYIDLPTGQASWHYHNDDGWMFIGLGAYKGEWDGHSTPDKYERLANLSRQEKPND